MRSTTLLRPLVLLFAGCAGGGSAGSTVAASAAAPSGGGAEHAGPLGFEGALAMARARDPNGLPVEVEREAVDGKTLIEVEMVRGDEVIELYYDPETRALVREAVEELEPHEVATLPALRQHLSEGTARLEDVLALARERYASDDVREVELEMHGEQLVMEVTVVRDGKASEMVHDPQSGALIGEEADVED